MEKRRLDHASRIFWLKRPFDLQSNEDTLRARFPGPSESTHSSEELFFEHYDSIREWVHDRDRPGLGIVALDEYGIQAKGFLTAHENRVNSAVLGRHEKADIFLGDDPILSLRHLAVLVAPTAGRGAPGIRVVDLRTALGFTDHRGTRIRSCESDGPFVIRCGRKTVLFAPASRYEPPWPANPETLWAKLEKLDAFTLVTPSPATLDDPLLSPDEDPLGELVISSEAGYGTIRVGRHTARAGILLGRSERCDSDALLSDPHISRVHVLVVEMAGRLYAVDTASKNGVWGKRGEERAQLLESGTIFSLCGLARVEWRFFH